MNRNFIHKIIVTGSSSLSLAAALLGTQAAFAQTQGGIADIVVTAQKREESLQDVPVAVTALSTEAIENAQVRSFTDLDGLSPNLSVAQGTSTSTPILMMRGIIGYNLANGVDSPIATYLNGVYLPRLAGAAFDAADLERVEVLRGPQGTLYGKNSTGGAISFITAAPKGEFYARQELTFGNDGRFRTKTRVDLPKVGAFSISGTLVHDEIDGYVRNSQPGISRDYSVATRGYQGVQTSPKSLGSNNSESGIIAVRYAPDSLPIVADYTFLQSDLTASPRPSQTLEFNPAVAQLIGAQPFVGGTATSSTTRLDEIAGGFYGHERLKTWAHMLTFTLDLPGDVQLKSITGYHGFSVNTVTDFTGNGLLVWPDPTSPSFGQPTALLLSTIAERSKNFSQEFQLTYDTDLLSLIGGVYYSRERTVSVTPTWIAQPVPVGVVPNDAVTYNDSTARNSSRAVFAQGTFHISDQLDFTGGLRYTNDKRASDSRSVLFGRPIDDFAETFNNVSWMANLTYRPSNDVMVYAKASTGYLSGGVFNGFAFDPEKVTQYEIGAKLDLLDRRLRVNAAAFYSDYKNKQVGQNNEQSIYVFQNAGQAKIKGFEVEVTAAPVDGVILTANYGYTDFKYDEYIIPTDVDNDLTTPPVPVDYAGTIRATRVPKHTIALGAEYKAPTIGEMQPSFNLNARWRSRIDLLPFPTYSAAADAAMRDNSFWDIDARASLAAIPLGRVEGKVSLWTQNLLNKKKIVDGNDLGLAAVATFGRGRTYGVDFAVEF